VHSYQIQAEHFKALMHPTRLAILEMLREGEECVCHMEAMLGLRQAHISQNLMVLRKAGFVSDRRDGWNIFYRVTKPEVYNVLDAMKTVIAPAGSGSKKDKVKISANFINADCICPKCLSVNS
jgi:DNA-binding transcriptional ArsR family regulator